MLLIPGIAMKVSLGVEFQPEVIETFATLTYPWTLLRGEVWDFNASVRACFRHQIHP